jgi:hypothetical protein
MTLNNVNTEDTHVTIEKSMRPLLQIDESKMCIAPNGNGERPE